MKVSNCCGADEITFIKGWPINHGMAELCPKCGEHCEYIEETDLNTINTENEQRTDTVRTAKPNQDISPRR